MASDILTDFVPDDDRLAVIGECIESYDVGTGDAEWPNNIISRKTIVFGNGIIAREGDSVEHRVDAAELALCKRLSREVCETMAGADVGMGSESSDPFRDFFIAARVGDAVADVIDESLIRKLFAGTLFPHVTITVEPLEEAGIWWSEVVQDGGGENDDGLDEYLTPWRAMMRWFHEQSGLISAVFVRIGDAEALWDVPREEWPAGTEVTGCVLPRMVVGLSSAGSLIGLFGHSVQT